jgi:hypothetical protein
MAGNIKKRMESEREKVRIEYEIKMEKAAMETPRMHVKVVWDNMQAMNFNRAP